MAEQYKIIRQRPDVEISPQGLGFQDVWLITYEVTGGPAKGTVDTIKVSNSDHNAPYIKTAIEDKLKHLHEIASL